MTYKYLTPIRVAHWLAQFDEETVVGRTGMTCSCPLAQCLAEINDVADVAVGEQDYCVGEEQRAQASWGRRFVALVDQLYGGVRGRLVTAHEARDVLRLALVTAGHRDYQRVCQILAK